MKLAVFLLVSSLASISFAQSNVSTSRASSSTGILRGLYVGLDYMNITDLKADAKYETNSGTTYKFKSEGGMATGTLGLRVGYDQTPEYGIGFAGGARYTESIHEDERAQFFIPEVNLTWAANRYFATYAGLNVAAIVGSKELRDVYKPAAGLQFGFMGRMTKNIALNAGYTIINQKLEKSDERGKMTGDVRFGGFTTSMNYIF